LNKSYDSALEHVFSYVTVCIYGRLEEDDERKTHRLLKKLRSAIKLASIAWMLSLLSVVPAFVRAQDRNGVILPFWPEVVSSSVGLCYIVTLVMCGIPLIGVYRKDNKFITEAAFILFEAVTLFISITQIYLNFYGVFRTALGKVISWFWTVGALSNALKTSVHTVLWNRDYRVRNINFMRKFIEIFRFKIDDHTFDGPSRGTSLSNTPEGTTVTVHSNVDDSKTTEMTQKNQVSFNVATSNT